MVSLYRQAFLFHPYQTRLSLSLALALSLSVGECRHSNIQPVGESSYFVPFKEFVRFRARPPPQRYPCRPRESTPAGATFSSSFTQQDEPIVDPPYTESHTTRNQEARHSEQYPMSSHPEDKSCILPMPTITPMPPEKCPWLFVILVRHQHPHPAHLSPIPTASVSRVGGAEHGIRAAAAFVFLPDHAEEERAGTVHDGNVRELPIAVVGDQGLHYELEERVVRNAAHNVVGDAGGMGAAHPCWIGQKGIETTVAALESELNQHHTW